VAGVSLRRSFYLSRHRRRNLSPLTRAFINFLERDFAASHPPDRPKASHRG